MSETDAVAQPANRKVVVGMHPSSRNPVERSAKTANLRQERRHFVAFLFQFRFGDV